MANVTLGQMPIKDEKMIGGHDTKKENKGSRVTVRMTGELGVGIEEIQRATSASSPSEVIRRAIAVYHTLVKQKLAGNEPQVLVVQDDGTKKTVPLFL